MTATDRIEINPQVKLGKPVIRCTRITVKLIMRKVAEGATEADLTEAYLGLESRDIKAAIAYAANTLVREETILLEPTEGCPRIIVAVLGRRELRLRGRSRAAGGRLRRRGGQGRVTRSYRAGRDRPRRPEARVLLTEDKRLRAACFRGRP